MRGEHLWRIERSISARGSSPHAQGTPHVHGAFLLVSGIIPACAGNTCHMSQVTIGARDHPRMRGEHDFHAVPLSLVTGSSPHARGTRNPGRPRDGRTGIIPACAGNTDDCPAKIVKHQDHPRMRGEHTIGGLLRVLRRGSSPHARGTLGFGGLDCGTQRIIPACAGNTWIWKALVKLIRDHPRMRGEHTCLILLLVSATGSSPHARGTLFMASRTSAMVGIIPACAGNTWIPTMLKNEEWDHPRMRGEHQAIRTKAQALMGSSPHARGTRRCEMTGADFLGIIPACAGNTKRSSIAWHPSGDHPRMRGEHGDCRSATPRAGGSSPHARGTLYPLAVSW